MFKFERLEVWKRSLRLYEEVSALTDSLPQRDQFSLGEQLRRAALSISTNIAEATGRSGEGESRHLFNVAKGSLYEVVSLLEVMKRRGYMDDGAYDSLYQESDELAKMLSGLLR